MKSFGWILLNPEFIYVIGTIPSYLGNCRKRVNFGNGVVEIQQKYERDREKVGKRKFWISVIILPKFLLPKPVDRVGVKCSKCEVPKGKPIWQCHCRNRGKKILWQFWQCHCRKWKEKKIMVAKIWGGIKKKKKSVTSTIFLQHFHNKSQVISFY